MSIDEEIKELIKGYSSGKYETKTFCDLLGTLYYFEKGGYKHFSGTEKENLDDLVSITERFSNEIEDLENEGVYYNEKQVRDKFNEVFKKLNW